MKHKDDDQTAPTGQGGRRPGAGRPRGSASAASKEFAAARAKNERLKADERELALRERMGDLLQKQDVEQTVAIAFSALTQDILSIPDRLERLHGIPADVAARVEEGLCAALEGLRQRMSKLGPVKAPRRRTAR